ncbi:MAG: hypothetical protein R6X05_08095 [Desulfobacterales bacterium]
MGKKNKRKKKSPRSSTTPPGRPPEQVAQLAESALAQGQLRKACTFFRQLCQEDPERYLGRWVEASQQLFDQLLAAGRLPEAKALLVSLERKVAAAAIRSSQIQLALRQGDFVRAAPLAAAEISSGGALTAPQQARAVDALVLVFQEDDPELALPPGLGADRQRVWQALALVSQANFEAALQAVRPVGLGSPFANWKWFVKGLCAFYTGQDPKADQAFTRTVAGSVPAKAAEAYLLLLGKAAGPAQELKNPALLQAACHLAGVGEAGAVIARADTLWQTGRYRDALRHVQRHLADFPSDRPGFQQDLTQFFYNAWRDLPARQADAYVEFLFRSAEKHRQQGAAGKFLAYRAEALWLDRQWCDDSEIIAAWEDVLTLYQARYGRHPRVQAIVYQHLGDIFAREEVEDTPFDFFFSWRRRKGVQLRNPRQAAHFYQQAVDADPDNPEGYFALLALYEKTAEKSKINKILDGIIRRFPDNKTALFKAGLRCMQRKAFNKGMGYLERALALDPIDAQAREGLVLACIQAALRYAQQGRMAQCQEVMQKALERGSPRTDDFNLGRCYLHVRWAVMADLGGDAAEAGRQMAAAGRLTEDVFRLHYFALLIGKLYDQPMEGRQESHRIVSRTLDGGLSVEMVLTLVDVLWYFRRLPPTRRRWLEGEEGRLKGLLVRAARLEWGREQARAIVDFALAGENHDPEYVRPFVKQVLRRHPDDPWFRWFRYLLDYGTHPVFGGTDSRARKELKAVLALAESAGESALAAEIRKVQKTSEFTNRALEEIDFEDFFEEEDIDDEQPPGSPRRPGKAEDAPPKKKLAPRPRQLDLF